MAKKIIAALLSASLAFGFSVSGSAYDKDAVPAVVNFFEKCGGTFVSLISRAINGISKTDESDIPKAENSSHSWTEADKDYKIESPDMVLETETWVMKEITLTSSVNYSAPFYDTDVDMILIGNGKKYVVPGFWAGENEWKIRFVCPEEGTWYFYTECKDTANLGLNGITGKVNCKKYSGNLEIYKHGFVTTQYGEKYLTYADGTPFLYLGDTHWSLGDETIDMVKIISKKRAEQGFTVIQSEPIGAKFYCFDGIYWNDIEGFNDYDEKFSIIANEGLVHANAEFFFPSYMNMLIENMGGYSDNVLGEDKKEIADSVKAYLEKLSRYWVARYGAYPVIWTLGQEVDNDFYSSDTEHPLWNYINNPYKLVAEYIDKYDCYDHPLTAHQENSGATSAYGDGNGTGENLKVYNKNANPSAFRNVSSHNLYAAQWTPSKTEQSNFNVEKDYWYNSQGKPVINYEGQYCYLWTKNYGARMQGWCAYLNGMYGASWGGHDTWSYLNTYNEDEDSSDGLDTITSEEKKNATWQDSLEYESSYQIGYMKKFLQNVDWYNLIPRFDNKSYFAPSSNVYYCFASNKDNTEGLIYFYSFTDSSLAAKVNTKNYGGILTGTIGNLEKNTEYKYRWVNPLNGEMSDEMTFISSRFGTYYIGERKWENKNTETDMVFWFYK